MRIIVGVISGFILGLIIGYILTLYTPIGNRYFLKISDPNAFKIDKWTGDIWWMRYFEETDEQGDKIKIWHWDKIPSEDEAGKRVFNIRDRVALAKEGEVKKHEVKKQSGIDNLYDEMQAKRAQKEKEQKEAVLRRKQAEIQRFKKIAVTCGTDDSCLATECNKDMGCISNVLYQYCNGKYSCIRDYCESEYKNYPKIGQCITWISNNASGSTR